MTILLPKLWFYVSPLSKNSGCVITVMRSATEEINYSQSYFLSCSLLLCHVFSLSIGLAASLITWENMGSVCLTMFGEQEKKKKSCSYLHGVQEHDCTQGDCGVDFLSTHRWHCCHMRNWPSLKMRFCDEWAAQMWYKKLWAMKHSPWQLLTMLPMDGTTHMGYSYRSYIHY